MKEIGGYFELEQLIDNEYYKKLLRFNTARNALLYLLRIKDIKTLFIPYYLCNTVSDTCIKNGFNIEFYNIDQNFMPIFNKRLAASEYLYVVNYFGQIGNEKVNALCERHKNIVIDNTQAFFQKPLEKVDTIYSCRKYFGVPDGSYLATDMKDEIGLQYDCSGTRWKHLMGRYEGSAQEYYHDFKDNEEVLNYQTLKKMSMLTRNILGAIDYGNTLKRRNENFLYLKKELEFMNQLDLNIVQGPFAYPIYLNDGLKIKKELAKKKIYIPTLWPNVLKENSEDSLEYKYAANILPLPCDQRYDCNDMKYLVEELIELAK